MTIAETIGGAFNKTNLQEIQGAFSKYVVAPAAKFGFGGFNFDIEGDVEVELAAEITDHFVEDNTALQDHIAIRPERLVLNSQVGELVYIDEDDGVLGVAQNVARKLITLGAYLPAITQGAQQAKNIFKGGFKELSLDNLDTAQDLWGLAKNLNPAATRQQKAYLYFKALFQKRIPVSVQTPFGYMQDMAIEAVTGVQSADSKYVSSFSITLKEIRTASTRLVEFDDKKYESRGQQQAAPKVDNGTTNGKKTSSILFDKVKGLFK